MSSQSDYWNCLEIEERIADKLPIPLKDTYKKLRTTIQADINSPLRLEQKKNYITHWERQADKLLASTLQKVIELDKQIHEHTTEEPFTKDYQKLLQDTLNTVQTPIKPTPTNMTDKNSDIGTAIANAITTAFTAFAEQQTQQQISNNTSDFYNKPKSYHGERDAQIIDLWTRSVEDYGDLKNYDNKKLYILAKTLIESDAKTWLYIVEQDAAGPLNDWIQLKQLISQTFKPANSTIILRDRLHQLQQTSTISEYIREFVKLKFSITNISNDEAVSQFVRGLRDRELKLKIQKLYRNDSCPPMTEALQEAYLHESSTVTASSSFVPNSTQMYNNRNTIDDPMDLTAIVQQVLAITNQNQNNNRGTYSHRGNYSNRGNYGYRGNHGYNGNDRFRSHNIDRRNTYRGRRGSNNKNHGYTPRITSEVNNTIQCYTCQGFGHTKYQCPSYRPSQKLNYIGQYGDEDNYHYENTNGSSSNERENFNKDNKDNDYSNCSDTPFQLFSVLPSSFSFVQPLIATKDLLQNDIDFIINAATVQHKLPLYHIYFNNQSYTVLIDSGATANYIHSRVMKDVTTTTTIRSQAVETANGQRNEITTKARFMMKLKHMYLTPNSTLYWEELI